MKNSKILKLSVLSLAILCSANIIGQPPNPIDFSAVDTATGTASTGFTDILKWVFYFATAVGLLWTGLSFFQNKQDAKLSAMLTMAGIAVSVVFSILYP